MSRVTVGFRFGGMLVVNENSSAAVPAHRGSARPRRADLSVYVRILESMSSGVMLVDGRGEITCFNEAAAALLGLERRAVLRRSFAEVFLAEEAFEDFNEAVLSAIYEGSVGYQRVVTVQVADRSVPFSISTSYLRQGTGESASRPGVVAVFNDISELEQLRAREIELAVDLETKHMELRAAYLGLEDRNRELAALLRKVQTVRVIASVFVVVVVAAIGTWTWLQPSSDWFEPSEPAPAALAGTSRSVAVESTGISSTLTIAAEIAPRREVVVRAPVPGTVGAVLVQPGSTVEAGDPLLELDVAHVRIERREAKIAHLKARAELEALESWETGVDVSRARRALTKARLALEAAKTRAAETAFLVEQGLAPSVRLAAAERERHTHQLDLEAAQQDLEAVLAQGREGREVARLELANATDALEKLDAVLRHSTVVAPVAGVVLPGRRGPSGATPFPSAGASVEAGAALLTVGDMEGLTATGRVDEVVVHRVRPGLGVRITGPAFPDLALSGRIVHVSSQASRSPGRGLPSFSLTAAVDVLGPAERAAVRLGMSADMEIVIYDAPDALVVPVSAVDLSSGRPRVRLADPDSGTARLVDVVTGMTTVDAVEIVEGLSAGDRVLVP